MIFLACEKCMSCTVLKIKNTGFCRNSILLGSFARTFKISRMYAISKTWSRIRHLRLAVKSLIIHTELLERRKLECAERRETLKQWSLVIMEISGLSLKSSSRYPWLYHAGYSIYFFNLSDRVCTEVFFVDLSAKTHENLIRPPQHLQIWQDSAGMKYRENTTTVVHQDVYILLLRKTF